MRNYVFVAFALVAAHASAQAVRVTNAQHVMSMSAAPNNALAVQIVGTEDDEALKDFVSFWKSRDAKPDVNSDEMKAENYEVKDLKPRVFTLYGRAEKENKSDCVVYLWVFNGSEFIDAKDPAYKHFEQEMKAFAVAENRKPVEKEFKEATKALEKLADDKQSLERDRADWQKDIDDCNAAIVKNSDKLKESEATVNDVNEKLKQQQSETDKLKQRIDAIQ